MNAPLVLRTRGLRPGNGGGATRCHGPLMHRLAQQQQHTDLFEARVRLKNGPTEVAFERAPAEDITFLDTALERTRNATNSRVFLEGILRLHRTLVTAADMVVLTTCAKRSPHIPIGSLTRASFVEGHEEVLLHRIKQTKGIVKAIGDGDRATFDAMMGLYHEDLIRVDDPRRSPDGRKVEYRSSPDQDRHA